MEYIILLILGLCFIILGIVNIKGNISSIHWYNRRKITQETSKQYGIVDIHKVVGQILPDLLYFLHKKSMCTSGYTYNLQNAYRY